ncbi:hypothetical protein ACROYT_G011197 [Oculina patagonica]
MAFLEIQLKHKIATIVCIFCISLGIIFPLCCGCFDDECRNIEFKEPVVNRAMKNHVIRSEEVPNEGTCRLLCYMEPSCVSINLGPLEGGKHKCELNNATDENQITMILVDKPSFTYLAIENPCSSSPCLNNGTCQAGFTSKGFRCICRAGFTGTDCSQAYKNCAEIYKSGERKDGVYTIQPDNLPAFDVFCDQTTAGGGWTVFQKRLDGSENFYLFWNDYKQGFGNLSGEFWLGNDKIHRLTSGGNERLHVDLEDFEGNITYAEYSTFSVMGTAGDSLASHDGQMFSTQDQDNDSLDSTHCAISYKGAWWFKACRNSNLNGIYLQEADPSPLMVLA